MDKKQFKKEKYPLLFAVCVGVPIALFGICYAVVVLLN